MSIHLKHQRFQLVKIENAEKIIAVPLHHTSRDKQLAEGFRTLSGRLMKQKLME